MKKKITVLALILGVMANTGLMAQGALVMDVSAIAAAIENGYTMMETLQTMYASLKTSYEQLQQQIKSYESFDFNQIDVKGAAGAWNSLNTYSDRMKAYEQNIESIINKKDIKIGNGSYSLGDVFTPPNKTMQSMATDDLGYVLDPLEAKLTPQERAMFHQKYGMSFGTHTRIDELGEELKKKSAEVVGYSTSLEKNLGEDREALKNVAKELYGSESIVQQQQINNAVMSIMAQDVKTQAKMLGDISQQLATSFSQAQIMKEAMQEEMNINDLEISEGFMKMLNGMESQNSYR
jgi:hypothetical protein